MKVKTHATGSEMANQSIKGLEELQRKLKRLEDFQKVMYDPMEESSELVRDWIATAPRKRAGAFTAMATPGQRRAYWARVKAGEINHGSNGYNRSENTSQGWAFNIRRVSNGLKSEIGNSKAKEYITFVQGPRQQPFHWVSGWRTTDEAIKENADKVQKIFDKAIKRELNR
jgi:hypothetical protein